MKTDVHFLSYVAQIFLTFRRRKFLLNFSTLCI
jgi:hypothetical protein